MPIISRRRMWLLPLITAGLAGVFGAGSWYGSHRVRTMNEWADAQLLSTAIDSVRANALDSLPSDELIKRAVAGMLRELHDPYAALLRPEGFARHRGTMVGEGQGMGVTLRRELDAAGVVRVVTGSPAFSAGIRAGDRILAIDTEPVNTVWNRPLTDRTRLFGDSSVLTVWRPPFGDTLRLLVKRVPWHMPAVTEHGLLSDSVGYVRLASITSKSSEELEKAVAVLLQRGARALVLDMRGNTGGLFEEGVKAAGLFLPRGAVVASLAGRGGASPQPHASRRSRWTTLPLTVLVDGNTASSAEVIAAALRDYDRALLIGSPTYGKGVVQRVVPLSKELSLRLTTARWLTPKGTSLARREGTGASVTGGLHPDVLLEDAAWRDPYAVPREWSTTAAAKAMQVSDSLAMYALREGWSTTPTMVLESRVRTALAPMAPRTLRDPVARAEWVMVATRLAIVRILEVERASEALLRYSAREDAALRAGIELVSPSPGVAHGLPPALPQARMLPQPLSDRALDMWLVTRFRGAQLLVDSMRASGPAAPAAIETVVTDGVLPRVEGTRDGRGADTLFMTHMSATAGAPVLALASVVQLAGPTGATTPLTARVLARRAFRAPHQLGRRPTDATAWRYGWSYALVLPRGERARPAARYRGWLPVTAVDSTGARTPTAKTDRQ